MNKVEERFAYWVHRIERARGNDLESIPDLLDHDVDRGVLTDKERMRLVISLCHRYRTL
jgi:hypothetical protein